MDTVFGGCDKSNLCPNKAVEKVEVPAKIKENKVEVQQKTEELTKESKAPVVPVKPSEQEVPYNNQSFNVIIICLTIMSIISATLAVLALLK